MKLILCPLCHDIRKLHRDLTECQCKKSWGWYKEDGWHAAIGGKAIVIGINNASLVDAIINQPSIGEGPNISAWVFAKDFERIERVKRKRRN